jgi:hypothetical protein
VGHESLANGGVGAYPLQAGESLVFGAVAKTARTGSVITNVNVSGTIDIVAAPTNRIKVGGVVGVSLGGRMSTCISNLTINISATTADVGGIVGSIEALTTIEMGGEQQALGNISVTSITVNGTAINVGVIVGIVRAELDENSIRIVDSGVTKVVVNGDEVDKQFVGRDLFKIE